MASESETVSICLALIAGALLPTRLDYNKWVQRLISILLIGLAFYIAKNN